MNGAGPRRPRLLDGIVFPMALVKEQQRHASPVAFIAGDGVDAADRF